ncbi:ABC transporter ATP-binding protein [Mesobacterium pallidum]|uniref:ABC transporter ATP-binding protein n=1 Tax=Mesobacterium pallidum TaxID=2872037 RepID=UPI001EE34FD6|nr:ABC transporter ATP-binding protein [Mesobacterium pallidum]
MTSSLELKGITKVFTDRKTGHQVRAVEDMSFSVAAGELVSVVGPSGCGKSTILNMVSGLYAPTEGEVLIDGEKVVGTRPEVGFMLQKDLLLPWRSIVKNVEFGLEEKKISKAERRERAMLELERMKLAEFADKYPHQLSGGMRQRAALARTLVIEPDIILLDEPFSALDAQTKLVLQRHFARTIAEAGVTCVLITHDLNEAVIMSDRVVCMSGRPGTVVDEFPIELGNRTDPLARSMESKCGNYVKRLFDLLHLEDQAA